MILAAWTMCVCVLMLAVAIITLGSIYSIDESATAFSAVYSIMFALILFVYEFMKFGCCIGEVQRIVGGFYGANLGFLYFPTSRGFFLVFIAFLQFGAKANPGSYQATRATKAKLFHSPFQKNSAHGKATI